MREVSGSTWTFQMIILFILIFSCFLTLVLSYSKAYTIKNRMLTIIEKYEGVTDTSSDVINNFIIQHSYKTVGKCPEDWIGAIDLEGDYEKAKENRRYYYCFTDNKTAAGLTYYDVMVFYKFNLPVLGEIATYKINGETKDFKGSNNQIIYSIGG